MLSLSLAVSKASEEMPGPRPGENQLEIFETLRLQRSGLWSFYLRRVVTVVVKLYPDFEFMPPWKRHGSESRRVAVTVFLFYPHSAIKIGNKNDPQWTGVRIDTAYHRPLETSCVVFFTGKWLSAPLWSHWRIASGTTAAAPRRTQGKQVKNALYHFDRFGRWPQFTTKCKIVILRPLSDLYRMLKF